VTLEGVQEEMAADVTSQFDELQLKAQQRLMGGTCRNCGSEWVCMITAGQDGSLYRDGSGDSILHFKAFGCGIIYVHYYQHSLNTTLKDSEPQTGIQFNFAINFYYCSCPAPTVTDASVRVSRGSLSEFAVSDGSGITGGL
jgi:hypothetical protein